MPRHPQLWIVDSRFLGRNNLLIQELEYAADRAGIFSRSRPTNVLYEIFFQSCHDKEHDLYLCIELAAAARRRCQVLDSIRPHRVIASLPSSGRATNTLRKRCQRYFVEIITILIECAHLPMFIHKDFHWQLIHQWWFSQQVFQFLCLNACLCVCVL